jgi:hypothetical protein
MEEEEAGQRHFGGGTEDSNSMHRFSYSSMTDGGAGRHMALWRAGSSCNSGESWRKGMAATRLSGPANGLKGQVSWSAP